MNRGIENGMHKLTEKDVRYIRELIKLGYGNTAISRFVGFISRTTVYKIKNNLLWKHLI